MFHFSLCDAGNIIMVNNGIKYAMCSLLLTIGEEQINKLNNNIVVNSKRNLQLICWTENDFFFIDTIIMSS